MIRPTTRQAPAGSNGLRAGCAWVFATFGTIFTLQESHIIGVHQVHTCGLLVTHCSDIDEFGAWFTKNFKIVVKRGIAGFQPASIILYGIGGTVIFLSASHLAVFCGVRILSFFGQQRP